MSFCRFAREQLFPPAVHAVAVNGSEKHVNDLSTCSRWSRVKRVVLGFPKRPHLPSSGTDSPRNDGNATMVDAKRRKREKNSNYTIEH